MIKLARTMIDIRSKLIRRAARLGYTLNPAELDKEVAAFEAGWQAHFGGGAAD